MFLQVSTDVDVGVVEGRTPGVVGDVVVSEVVITSGMVGVDSDTTGVEVGCFVDVTGVEVGCFVDVTGVEVGCFVDVTGVEFDCFADIVGVVSIVFTFDADGS